MRGVLLCNRLVFAGHGSRFVARALISSPVERPMGQDDDADAVGTTEQAEELGMGGLDVAP